VHRKNCDNCCITPPVCTMNIIIMVALCNRAEWQTIIFLPCGFFFFLFFLPNLSRGRLDVYQWCGLSANFRCRSETCCTRLAENPGCKTVTESHHLRTIAQFCRAISSQLRHVLTIGKNLLSTNTSSTCPHNMTNFGPLTAEIGWPVWGIPANFNGFRILTALLHGTPVVGVSQTLRRRTEGATYIRQGDHHVGHWPTFLVV